MTPLIRCRGSRDGTPVSEFPTQVRRHPDLAFRCPTSRRTVRPRWSSGSWDHWRSRPTKSRSRRAGRRNGHCSRIHRLQLARRGRGKSGDTRPYAVNPRSRTSRRWLPRPAAAGGAHDRHRPFLRAARSSSATRQASRATASTTRPPLSGSDSQESCRASGSRWTRSSTLSLLSFERTAAENLSGLPAGGRKTRPVSREANTERLVW